MSTRYDDTNRDREYSRRRRYEREPDDRETSRGLRRDDRESGRGLRRDVRESGQDIRAAGGDIISSWCNLWGNLFISIGEAISFPSSSGRSRSGSSEEGGERQGGFNCSGGEFSIRCDRSEACGGRASEGYADRNAPRNDWRDDRRDERRDERTTARYSSGDTKIDVTT